jgi:hypothetical protein
MPFPRKPESATSAKSDLATQPSIRLDVCRAIIEGNRAARSLFGANGCGLAEFALYDERRMIGSATRSLAVRLR